MSNRKFILYSFVLGMIIIFCVRETTLHMENEQLTEEKHYYSMLEQEYTQSTRAVLEQEGFGNCGVSMTKVTNIDGSKEYMVRIYHRRLERMSEMDKSILKDRLAHSEFRHDVCTFQYDL